MTDNEIIKALECCIRNDHYIICNSDCPMYEYCESDEEDEMNICGLALNLINRQRAEIEKLKDYNANLLTGNTALSNEILEIKSEAIKEFAERLKEKSMTKFDWSDAVDVEDIDDLVKEMTEEKENA